MMYALRHTSTGQYLTVSVTSNGDDAEFCNSYSAEFDTVSGTMEPIWVTQDRAHAEAAMNTDTPWYNSCVTYPQNQYVGKLEIVELQPLA